MGLFERKRALKALSPGRKGAGPKALATAAVAVLILPLASCQKKPAVEPPAQPFVFRSLNLQQHDLLGQLSWSLTSPEARYDLGRKLAQTRDLRGVVFDHGRPKYQLSATSATLLNDGAVIQLEGKIQLQRLGPQPLTVVASRARWYPNEQLVVLDQDPVGTQRNLRVSARKARFLLAQHKLELRGHPLLERQPDGQGAPAGGPQTNGRLRLQVRSADWFTESGDLTSEGPVIGVREVMGPDGIAGKAAPSGQAAPAKPQRQVLTSPALRGNSRRQLLTLLAPVKLVDQGRQASLDALETDIDLVQELIQSSLPFHGVLNQSQVTGVGFQLFTKRQLAVVRSQCFLQQPTDSLRADQCQWNWATNQVQARGQVLLQRQANHQITKAQRIDGHLGSQGLVVFSSPGSRVNTQLKLKTRPKAAGKPVTGSRSAGQGGQAAGALGPPIQL